MKTITICEFCEHQCIAEHEAKCDANPANQTCTTCKHFDWWPSTINDPDWGHYEDDGEWVSDMGCLKYRDQEFRTQCPMWEARESLKRKE